MLPTAQDLAASQGCSHELHPISAATAAGPFGHAQQPHESMYLASTCGPFQACCSSEQCTQPYSRSLYVAPSEADSSQHHPFWEVSGHSPENTVAVGWPVPDSTAPMQRLTPPSLVSTQAASKECQTQAAAVVPVQQQQHPLHKKHICIDASPGQIKDSQKDVCLQSQTSYHSITVHALRDSPCMVPAGKPCSAVIDTSTIEQNTVLPKAVECQQHPVGTDMNMLAGTVAHHDFGQVMLP